MLADKLTFNRKMEEKDYYWRKLDNSAKIFPLSVGKKYNAIFRISCVLKEEIQEEILQEAVEKALQRYELFRVKMKKGFFWYYLEYNAKTINVEKETQYPCKEINQKENQEYLFKITYFETKINIEINHILTDGNSGVNFCKEIIYSYLEIAHRQEFEEENRMARKIELTGEDSYIKNYDKKAKNNNSSKKAYLIRGSKIALGAVAVFHEIVNLEQLKKVAKEQGATITQYLSAVLIYAIVTQNYKGKRPIKLCIPVNLKKYFASSTLANFFSYITLEAEVAKENLQTFPQILEFVKKDFEKRLTEEEILKTMSANVKLGNNVIIRAIPLILKKVLVRLAYTEIRKYTTLTFSNIGRIGMIGKYQNYIENFLFLIAPDPIEKIKCSACTFENKLVFTFTTILEDNKIEIAFRQFLQEQGIEVKEETNGVLS